jgi:hypothetical protein
MTSRGKFSSLGLTNPHAHRSFIASYLGNIVGALLVALPAVYFYLGDYNAGGLVKAEAGELTGSGSPEPDKRDSVNWPSWLLESLLSRGKGCAVSVSPTVSIGFSFHTIGISV